MKPLRDQDTVQNVRASEATFPSCLPLNTAGRISTAVRHVQGCGCWGLLPAHVHLKGQVRECQTLAKAALPEAGGIPLGHRHDLAL